MIEQKLEELGGVLANCPARTPVTAELLAQFEARLGHPLPAEYAAFLLAHPEGSVKCKRSTYVQVSDDEGGHRVYLDAFFSLYPRSYAPGFDLTWQYESNDGLIPRHLLPVIGDSAGDYICIAIDGPHLGAIYHWDHERIDYDSEEPSEENVFFVAPTFGAFINLIQAYSPDP